MPVDTFVVPMMENRSFDHYLGWLPGADGRQAGLSYVDRDGKTSGSGCPQPCQSGASHCSLMAATLPNREYMHAAQSYGLIDNDLPPQTQYQTGFPVRRSSRELRRQRR